MIKRYWTPCSKFVNKSRLNNQNHWGNLYDYLTSTKIFTLIMNKSTCEITNYEENWLRARFGCAKSSCTTCMFHILQEASAELKVSV